MKTIKRYYEHPNWRDMETLSNKLIASNFNQIHLQVIEDIASLNDGHLSEHIFPSICDYHKKWDNAIVDDCDDCDDIDKDYPIWNATFEIKEPNDEWIVEHIRTIQEFGFVTIQPFHCFNTILAFNGGGYNFHEMHWIPLFLNVFENCEMLKLYEVAK
tara:strand:- start:9 stop:482 length:474 start_codon:yes stop_codon:yes gene_type:complete